MLHVENAFVCCAGCRRPGTTSDSGDVALCAAVTNSRCGHASEDLPILQIEEQRQPWLTPCICFAAGQGQLEQGGRYHRVQVRALVGLPTC